MYMLVLFLLCLVVLSLLFLAAYPKLHIIEKLLVILGLAAALILGLAAALILGLATALMIVGYAGSL